MLVSVLNVFWNLLGLCSSSYTGFQANGYFPLHVVVNQQGYLDN